MAKSTKKLEKAHIAAKIVSDIRSMEPGGRFLKEDRDTGLWFDIGDAKAIKKAGQALREDAPDIRHEIGDEEAASGDEKKETEQGKKTSFDESEKPKKTRPPRKDYEKKPTKETSDPSASMKKQGKKSIPPPRSQPVVTLSGGAIQQPPTVTSGNGKGQTAGLTPQEIQAQASMPPPHARQGLAAQQQGFQGMNTSVVQASIPLGPAPQVQTSYFTGIAPSRVYPSGNRSVAGGGNTSRHAMEFLAQTPQPEDVAFGRPFAHPPPPTSVLSATDNTMSSISGISDPLSSGFGLETGSGFGSRGGSRVSGHSNGRRGLGHFRGFLGGSGRSMPQQYAPDQQVQAGAISNPYRSSDVTGSAARSGSNRSEDCSAISGDSGSATWRAMTEELADGGFLDAMSLSSAASRGRGTAAASVMSASMASMSIGSGISAQWIQGAEDVRSMLSDMSAEVNALDLAGTRG